MRHSLAIYQSDKEKFSKSPTAIFWLHTVFVLALFVSFFAGGFTYILGAAGVHMALWLTNQQWGMEQAEIEFWQKYQSLPRNYRKALDLTPKYVRELDGRAWSQAKQKVDNIYDMRRNNLQENDLPDGLAAKFAAIEQSEKEFAQMRREREKELSSRGWH